MNDKLLPCPFCGGKARWTGRYVQCYDCDIRTDEYSTDYNNTAYAKATSAWNRRTQPNEPVKHGKWKPIFKGADTCECSVCKSEGFSDSDFGFIATPYCPNCGAEMEVEP